MKKRLGTLALVMGLAYQGSTHADILNGDFSTGFSGWSGQVDYLVDYDAAAMDAVTTPDFFSITSFGTLTDAAKLSTHYNPQNGTGWAVSLFQTFTMPSLTHPNNRLWLEFDLFFSTDDPSGGDTWLAQLTDQSGSMAPVDLTSITQPFEVTAYSGLDVELLFSVENIAGGDDSLVIDNLRITEEIFDPVPAPSVLALLGLTLLAWRRKLA